MTFLAYANTRLLFADGKNTDSGNSDSLMLILISCWNEFSFFERDLEVGGKDLKIGGKRTFFVGQSSGLCKIFKGSLV